VADSEGELTQAEIERLMAEAAGAAQRAAPKKPAAPPAAPAPAPAAAPEPEDLVQDEIEKLLAEAQRQTKANNPAAAASPVGAAAGTKEVGPRVATGQTKPFPLQELNHDPVSADPSPLELISDVELDMRIELGRTHMRLEDVLRLRGGSVVVLDKLAGDPVDVFVNGRLVARGEVLVMNDNFCVRVTELLGLQP
jgi:flagellar motor switch protein FliN